MSAAATFGAAVAFTAMSTAIAGDVIAQSSAIPAAIGNIRMVWLPFQSIVREYSSERIIEHL